MSSNVASRSPLFSLANVASLAAVMSVIVCSPPERHPLGCFSLALLQTDKGPAQGPGLTPLAKEAGVVGRTLQRERRLVPCVPVRVNRR